MRNNYRPEGRYITAEDVADRLIPDLYIHEVLLWAPDLFAYTSYILMMTSAYQLVVSPPSGKTWPPEKENDIMSWLKGGVRENLSLWLEKAIEDWDSNRLGDKDAIVNDIVGKFDVELTEINAKFEAVKDTRDFWDVLVQTTGKNWQNKLNELDKTKCKLIDDTGLVGTTDGQTSKEDLVKLHIKREIELLDIVLDHTPALLLACWAFFFKEMTSKTFYHGCKLQITELLCNQDDQHRDLEYRERVWKIAQSLLTMHAIADIASAGFGVFEAEELVDEEDKQRPAEGLRFAKKLLFGRAKGVYKDQMFYGGGSLSTFNSERVRILPKRHNPFVGITLRSISSNLAFHQSAVDVVWRKAQNNPLGERMVKKPFSEETKEGRTLSILLFPFPLTVRTNDFRVDDKSKNHLTHAQDKNSYFFFDPEFAEFEDESSNTKHKEKIDKERGALTTRIKDLITEANKEHPGNHNVDMIIFPEAALSQETFRDLENEIIKHIKKDERPSVIIAGVRESREDIVKDPQLHAENENEVSFPRNAVYCKYYDSENNSYYFNRNEKLDDDIPVDAPLKQKIVTSRFKQYKHHRWHLSPSQIRQYGLSSVLDTDPDKFWWESIKIPKRRVSFLNVGNRLTISHLICEDLARQDPIAELIRHVGPSLVVAILMDGPQLKTRWSARYATVLADDPGCSVITLTSLGMVKRHSSEFGRMTRVIGLWNDSESTNLREIELAHGAEAVLLTLEVSEKNETTADGRVEEHATSVLKLQDVIQIYPS